MSRTAYPSSLAVSLHPALKGTHEGVGAAFLRIATGLFMVPHGIAKFASFSGEVDVFGAVFGLQPAYLWVFGIAVLQIVCGLAIVFRILLLPALLVCAAILAGTIAVASGAKGWFWHLGGAEYAAFWIAAIGSVLLSETSGGSTPASR